jgi:hypothetical protein
MLRVRRVPRIFRVRRIFRVARVRPTPLSNPTPPGPLILLGKSSGLEYRRVPSDLVHRRVKVEHTICMVVRRLCVVCWADLAEPDRLHCKSCAVARGGHSTPLLEKSRQLPQSLAGFSLADLGITENTPNLKGSKP